MGLRERFGIRLLDDDDLAAVADEQRAAIVGAAAGGRAVDGRALGTYKRGPQRGGAITLRQTGALLDGLRVSRERGAAHLDAPDVRYAEHVLGRFDVLQIDEEQTTAALERRFDDKQRPS